MVLLDNDLSEAFEVFIEQEAALEGAAGSRLAIQQAHLGQLVTLLYLLALWWQCKR